MKKLLMVAVAATALTPAAQAQTSAGAFTGAYAGVQVGHANARIAEKTTTSSLNYSAQGLAVNGMFGYGQLFDNTYVGGELVVGQDSHEDLAGDLSSSMELKTDLHYGLNGRFGYLVAQKAIVYFSLAALYDHAKVIAEYNGREVAHAKKKGFVFVPGIGTEVALTDDMSLRLDYTYQLPKTLKVKNAATGAETGYKYKVSKSTFKVGVAYHF